MNRKYVFFCVALLIFAGCSSKPSPQADHHAYHNPVVQPFTDAVLQHPDQAAPYFQRAAALRKVKEDSLALLDLQKAVSLDERNSQYIQALGILYLDMGEPAKAVKALQQNLKLSPGEVSVRLLLSKAYLQNGQVVPAQEEVEKVLAAAPDFPQALYWKAHIEMAGKDSAEAINTLKQVLAAHPDYYLAAYQLADWYAAQDNPETVAQYQRTFQIDTMDVAPLFDIGEYFKRRKDFQKAKEAYKACVLKDPDYSDAYIETGKILFLQDSFQKALRQFSIAIETSPANAKAYLNKGLCFEQLHQKDSARLAFRQALIFDPGLKTARAGWERLK